MIPGRWRSLCLACLACLAPGPLSAQDLEPRSYANVPVDQTYLVLGYAYSEGELSPTPTSTLENAELEIDAQALGMAHTFSLAGDAAKIDLLASRLCFQGSATFEGEFIEGQRCEYGDPHARLTWNFYGAPALSLQDFADWQPGLVAGASLQVSAPLGSYTSEHLINAGTDRWMLRPGLGISWRAGRWFMDLSGSVRLFEDSDNGFRGSKREQDPIYAVQSHLIYVFAKGRWLSVDANFFHGGETTVNGVARKDLQKNSRWGLTYSFPLNRHHSIKLNASTGVVTRVGNDFDSYGIAWLYRF